MMSLSRALTSARATSSTGPHAPRLAGGAVATPLAEASPGLPRVEPAPSLPESALLPFAAAPPSPPAISPLWLSVCRLSLM